jgi:hypothetical protein
VNILKPFREVEIQHETNSGIEEDGSDWSAGIVKEKFTCHPDRITQNPTGNCQIVKQFAAQVSAFPAQIKSKKHCGQNHQHTQGLIQHQPAEILEQPEYNMKVLFGPELQRGHSHSFKRKTD